MKNAPLMIASVALLCACPGGGNPDGGGGGVTRTELPAPVDRQFWNARWAPDGKKIALHLAIKGASSSDWIAVMDESGNNVTELADAGTYLATAAWGPGGTSVYYTDDRGISKVAATGGASTQVAAAGAAFELDVSKDGTRLTYTENGIGNISMIELADAGTSSLHTGEAARFSPDGTQVAFVQGNLDLKHFWLYKFADKSVTDLGLAGTYLASVGWFADGKRIAVTTDKGIEVLDLGASPVGRNVIYSDAFASTGVDVSPDSTKILYRVNGQTGLFILTGF